jgi:hypothetical protein
MVTNKQIKVSDFQDKFITCCECQDEFLFSAGEQAYFTSKGLNEPKRCKACRQYRKVTLIVQDDKGATR